MALNYVFSAPALNAGNGTRLADFNFSTSDMNAAGGVGRAYPGMAFAFHGNIYQVVQNRSGGALAAGDVVSLLLGDATRTGNLTGASTSAVVVTDDTQDTGLAGVRDYPGYIAVTAAALATTADMEVREIQTNAPAAGASTVTVASLLRELGPNFSAISNPDGFSTTPDVNYDYQVFCPWEVVKSDLDALVTSIPQGVVVSTTITDDYFGIIQVRGLGVAKVDGTTDCVAGELLIPDSAAGVLSKWVVTTTDPTTAQVNQGLFVFGRILEAYTNNGVGKRLVHIFGTRALLPELVTA